MNLMEARRFLRACPGGEDLPFLLAASGEIGILDTFVKAQAALYGRAARPRLLPFGTLGQTVHGAPQPGETEVFLILPWDLVPEADWRSGLPAQCDPLEVLRRRAETTLRGMAARPLARLVYLPAPLPPILSDMGALASLQAELTAAAAAAGAVIAPAELFALASYLGSGNPIAGAALWDVAGLLVDAALGRSGATGRKVLATDCDGVLWAGLAAEDGLEALRFGPEGKGFKHFLYQTLLRRLRQDGTLLAAVSRNRPEDVTLALAAAGMTVTADDFVAVAASYDAKSARIAALARQLNLGLDSFVFVDDNPIEIADVSAALPQVTCLAFPANDDEMPAFLGRLGHLFSRAEITDEDRRRTDLYRMRQQAGTPEIGAGADLGDFLASLDMRLEVRRVEGEDWQRPFQLINKTNQFNLNGRRFDENEFAQLLAGGCRLYAARLRDRAGDHGEILACLISPDGVAEALVLSCRAFQRRVEHAFMAWLSRAGEAPSKLRFSSTSRNEPLRTFLADPAFVHDGQGLVEFHGKAFLDAHADTLILHGLEPCGA